MCYSSLLHPSPIQQEGVPSHLLPAVVQAQKEAAAEAAAKEKDKVANYSVHLTSIASVIFYYKM